MYRTLDGDGINEPIIVEYHYDDGEILNAIAQHEDIINLECVVLYDKDEQIDCNVLDELSDSDINKLKDMIVEHGLTLELCFGRDDVYVNQNSAPFTDLVGLIKHYRSLR